MVNGSVPTVECLRCSQLSIVNWYKFSPVPGGGDWLGGFVKHAVFLVCLSMLCFLCDVTIDQLNKIDDEVQRHLDDKLAILRTLQVWCMFCVLLTCVVHCTCTVSTSLLRSALLQQYNYERYPFLDHPNCAKRLHQYFCTHFHMHMFGYTVQGGPWDQTAQAGYKQAIIPVHVHVGTSTCTCTIALDVSRLFQSFLQHS